MSLVITDVSVLFDLHALEVLPEFFALDMEISTTSFVYNEIVRGGQKELFDGFVRSKNLKVLSFTEDETTSLFEYKPQFRNRSMNDLSIIFKAMQLNSIVLTCDSKIRKEAEFRKLRVHGSIWVLMELHEQKLISNDVCIALLEKLKGVNTRLPIDEIEKCIKRLRYKI